MSVLNRTNYYKEKIMELNYIRQRHLIHDADVLLFRSTTFPHFGWWIGKYTNSMYSHAALAHWQNDELYCLEFREFEGSREYPIIKYLNQGDRIDVFRPCSYIEIPIFIKENEKVYVDYVIKNFTIETQNNIINTAKKLMGHKYSWWTIWQLAKNYIPFIRLRTVLHKNGEVDPRNFVCSTLVSYSYRINYIDPVPQLCDVCTTPGDLARSALFFKIFEISF
jgi:hypothetical protein